MAATVATVPSAVGTNLLYPALRKAGVTLGPQRTPSPAQFKDAIDELNRLLGSLNCDPMWIYSQELQTFPLTAGKKIYTIGIDPTGASGPADFPVPAPRGVSNANYLTGTPVLRTPVSVLTPQQWQAIGQQDLPNSVPQGIYYDRGYPIGRIYISGQPPDGGQLEFMGWHLISAVGSTTDVITWPQGYEDAVVLQLACRLAPQFGLPVDADLRLQARDSLMRVLSMNAPAPVLDISGGIGCGCGGDSWNIYRG